MRRKLWQVFIVCAVLASLTKSYAYAQEGDFDTTYNIEYQVDSSLTVSVKETIAAINQSSGAVPSSFIETIKNISIYDIKVADAKDKEIEPQVEIKEGEHETVVRIPIKDPAVGKNKKTTITFYYKTKDLAEKTGRILNLHIPKAPVSNFMQEYNVTVKIPKDFGPQISITPKPAQEKMEEEGYVLLYNKQTLEKYGISASFGDYQIFDFELAYNLTNDSFLARNMSITLPLPVKDYQEVNVLDITPQPLRVKKDADGNVTAVYKVGGKKSIKIKVVGKAKVYTKKANVASYNLNYKIPKDLERYTKPQPYWESRDREIMKLAQNLTSKEKDVMQNALSIYTYLTKNISYDFDQAKEGGGFSRRGGLQTLKDKKGLCLGFTDLFIALARAAGIPAREVDGYAYAKDFGVTPTPQAGGVGNYLHSWVQYYSPQMGWISVDPTWGATSGLDFFSRLDNNHLAFVIKGIDSQNPQPAAQFSVKFSKDDFFSHDSLYDLENLPQDGNFTLPPLLAAGAFVLGLGLCTILVLAKGRSKRRYK